MGVLESPGFLSVKEWKPCMWHLTRCLKFDLVSLVWVFSDKTQPSQAHLSSVYSPVVRLLVSDT